MNVPGTEPLAISAASVVFHALDGPVPPFAVTVPAIVAFRFPAVAWTAVIVWVDVEVIATVPATVCVAGKNVPLTG